MILSLKYAAVSTKKLLEAATGTLRVNSELGEIVVPFKLKAFKSDMKWMVEACNPLYQNKNEKWCSSFLSVHLSSDATAALEKLVSVKLAQELAMESRSSGKVVRRDRVNKTWVKIVDEGFDDFTEMAIREATERGSSTSATPTASTKSAEEEANSALNPV